MKRKTTYINKQTTINQEGEVISKISSITSKLPSEPPFVKLYLDHIVLSAELPKHYSPLLQELLSIMTYANHEQKIYINGGRKQEIVDKLGYSKGHIDNALSKMTKSGLLKRIGSGTYVANPNLFGKGEWKDIYELRLNMTFNNKGVSISSDIVKDTGEE